MNPTIEQIVEASARSMSQVEVTLDRRFPTVSIVDVSGDDQDEIFLQGDDAVRFEFEVDALMPHCPCLNEDHLVKHMAAGYVDSFWN